MGAIANQKYVLPAAVANAGTVVIPAYPAGFVQADLSATVGGRVAVNSNDVYPQAASGAGTVLFTFGASTITLTNNSGIPWPAGSELIVSYGVNNRNGSYNLTIGTAYNQAKAGNL